MLITELHTRHIADTYRRFASTIGDAHWKKCVNQCKQAIKGNEFLREHFEYEHAIAYQLNRLGEMIERYGTVPLEHKDLNNLYPASSFAAQVLSLMDAGSKENAEKLRRRVHGAFKKPADIRGLRLELAAATHFARRGKRVSWPETTGIGTFDLLVEEDNHPPLEVECKSIANDKGRKIHKVEMLEFFALLKPYLQSTTKGLTQGLSVVLTVPGRLPSIYKDRLTLAKALGRAVFEGNSCTLAGGSTVRITDFNVAQLGDVQNIGHPRELRQAIDGVTGTNNRHSVLIATAVGGALALTLQSARDDSLLKSVFDTLSDAARQLSATRAGMLFTGFEGLGGEELHSVAMQDEDAVQSPTALRLAASQFLSSPARDHVIGVGFVSRSVLQPIGTESVSYGGTAYYFPKRGSSFWSECFSGMFNWS